MQNQTQIAYYKIDTLKKIHFKRYKEIFEWYVGGV
jgi:hypothetical protein